IDVATDTNRIYVVDAGGDKVYGFKAAGELALVMGLRGGLAGEFRYPSAITVDEAHSRLIVADHDNYRIQKFTIDGMFDRQFGYRIKFTVEGYQEGWIARALGLAVDAEGRIYVADAIMSTVRIFESTGLELGRVVEYGHGPGAVRNPCDLALSNDGSRLYVVSTNTSSVEVYQTPAFTRGDSGSAQLDGPGTDRLGTNYSAHDLMYRVGLSDMAHVEELRKARWHTDGVGEQGGTSVVRQYGYDPPHINDATYTCGRCHDFDGQPGGHLGLVEGQRVLCLSCHHSGGQALAIPMHELDLADPFGTNPDATDGRGRSHAWGVPAVNAQADSVGPTPGGEMERYLDTGGNIKCSTCHNQHNSDVDSPFLRVSNEGDAMCKQCHAPRDKGPGEGGTHPVGFDYPGGVGEFPVDAELDPLQLKDLKVECLTCHAPHNADSGRANDGEGDGMLLRAANDGTLCRTCHTDHIGHTTGGGWQPNAMIRMIRTARTYRWPAVPYLTGRWTGTSRSCSPHGRDRTASTTATPQRMTGSVRCATPLRAVICTTEPARSTTTGWIAPSAILIATVSCRREAIAPRAMAVRRTTAMACRPGDDGGSSVSLDTRAIMCRAWLTKAIVSCAMPSPPGTRTVTCNWPMPTRQTFTQRVRRGPSGCWTTLRISRT
ncbi:MAG: cytochrome c3 family protein, partial [Planctomycetota bacterium]